MFDLRKFASFAGAAALLLCPSIAGSQERTILVGRLAVDRAGDRLAMVLVDIRGNRRQIQIPPAVLAGNNGLDAIEGRWLVLNARLQGRFPIAASMSIVTRDNYSCFSDPLVRTRLPKLKDLGEQKAGYSGRVSNLYDALRAGVVRPGAVPQLAMKGRFTLGKGGTIGARCYIDDDARHYFLLNSVSDGVSISEVKEDNLVPANDVTGCYISRDVSVVGSPMGGSIWYPGQTFVSRMGSIRIDQANAETAQLTFHPMTVTALNEVKNTNDSGSGSLRSVITYCNFNAVKNINFRIPVTDPGFDGKSFRIDLTGALPAYTVPAGTIWGSSQTKNVGDTNLKGPEIYVYTASNDTGMDGIKCTAEGMTVDGVAVGGFTGAGVRILGRLSSVQGCYLGVRPTGDFASPNAFGLIVASAPDCLVGGSPAARNVMSGNSVQGILILSSPVCYIQSNYIGTDATGMSSIPNTNYGIDVQTNSYACVIGGDSPEQRNVISGNAHDGIYVEESDAIRISGNYIGLATDGNVSLPNAAHGLIIVRSNHAVVGGTNPGEGNVVSSNIAGIAVLGLEGAVRRYEVKIMGNIVGLSADGLQSRGNSSGIFCGYEVNAEIGNAQPSGRNIISRNTYGISLAHSTGGTVEIQGNYIGTDPNGQIDLGNQGGIKCEDDSGYRVHIGGTQPNQRNIISGNATGLIIYAPDVTVEGNWIGLNASGTATLAGEKGVLVMTDSPGVRIGTTVAGGGNVICGNSESGVEIRANYLARVQNNLIGESASGQSFGNAVGIRVTYDSNNNIIGGTGANEGNVICSSSVAGILVTGASQFPFSNLVQGNLVGVDRAGRILPNQSGIMVRLGANHNTIGGAASGARNIVSGNTQYGIYLGDAGVNYNSIQGNWIGLGLDGTTIVPNGSNGITLASGAKFSVVGTELPNDIVGNRGLGVRIADGGTLQNTVRKNRIRANVVGQIQVDSGASSNTITQNAISGAIGQAALVVKDSGTIRNNLRGNTFSVGNRLLVNLVGGDSPNGVTVNDADDADTGPNNLQNYAELSSAVLAPGSLTYSGSLTGLPNKTYAVDVYAVDVPNSAGFGGNVRLILVFNVMTNSSGVATFSKMGSVTGSPVGLCTQVTDEVGNTSEFGKNKLF